MLSRGCLGGRAASLALRSERLISGSSPTRHRAACFLERCPGSQPALGQHAQAGRVQGRGLPDDPRRYALRVPTPAGGTAWLRVLIPPLLAGYLKLWQLSKPLLASFDAIFVDEAQDCTPGERRSGQPQVSDAQNRVWIP